MIETETARAAKEARSAEKVAWILGAGFSKALDGPLFAELFDSKTADWVFAWLQVHQCQGLDVNEVVDAYEKGRQADLWSNAEECLSRLDEARTNPIVKARIESSAIVTPAQDLWVPASQYIAIATSFFVDLPSAQSVLPEAWQPYVDWVKSLTKNDTIVSFNYDRVVETIAITVGREPSLLKLHGTVPSQRDLQTKIEKGQGIDEIATPGPRKTAAMQERFQNDWIKAKAALETADTLIVVGYSFPPSDTLARSVVLQHSNAKRAKIVLGHNSQGDNIGAMFRRKMINGVTNTGLLTEEFLCEGTVPPLPYGRFNHYKFR